MNRVQAIEQRLREAFAPTELSVLDEGHKHLGHAGAKDGRGHFQVRVVSDAFVGKSPLERHRMVYAALGSLMQTDIHALGVDAQPKEPT